MISVADLMTTDLTTLPATASLNRAAGELDLGHIRHLPVVDGQGRLLGLLTHRDLLRHHRNRGAEPRSVADIMTRDIKTVAPDTPAHEAAYLLLRHAIGCVPVTDSHGVLVGIVTDTDLIQVAYRALGGVVPVEELTAEEREADNV